MALKFLEVCPLTKTDLKSLDFVINKFYIHLYSPKNGRKEK